MSHNGPGGVPPGYYPVDSSGIDRSDLVYRLQTGVLLRLPGVSESGGISVTNFLMEVMNLDRDSLKDEIRTIMRNHFVVDDPDDTYLKSGDNLVVSGAMPGLVGAMLRSDSPIKILRSTISGGNEDETGSTDNQSGGIGGFITMKAFNTVLRDHLYDILRYGIYIEESDG